MLKPISLPSLDKTFTYFLAYFFRVQCVLRLVSIGAGVRGVGFTRSIFMLTEMSITLFHTSASDSCKSLNIFVVARWIGHVKSK